MWKTVELSSVATVTAGQSPKGKHYNKEGRGTPFYQGKKDYGETYLKEPTVWTEVVTKLAEKDDILMSVRAPVGSLNIATQQICIGRGLAAIRPSTEILHDFLFYSLLLISKQLKGNVGIGFNSINKAQIEAIKIPLPPLAEQERIVAKLDAAFAEIDDEISLCKQSIDNTNDLFIRHLDYIFENQNLLNSKEWIKSPLKDLCNNFKADIVDGPFGSNLKKSDYIESGIEVLKIQNIKPFHINNKKMSFVSKAKYHELKRHSFISGDIIMTKLGEPLGVCAIVEDLKQGLIVADLVRIRAARINTEFLCYQLNSPTINRYINSQQTGSGRKRIRLSVARELPIVYPSMKVQHQIVKSLDKIKNDIESLLNTYNSKLSNLDSLKSSILNHTLTENIKGNAA